MGFFISSSYISISTSITYIQYVVRINYHIKSMLYEFYLMDVSLAIVVSLASIKRIGIDGDITRDFVLPGKIRYHSSKRLMTLNQFLSTNN